MGWVEVVANNDNQWTHVKPQEPLSELHGAWIKTVIASNPFADEAELLSFFVKHGFPEGESKRWIACRQQPLEDY